MNNVSAAPTLKGLQATPLNRNLIRFPKCIGHWFSFARIFGHAVSLGAWGSGAHKSRTRCAPPPLTRIHTHSHTLTHSHTHTHTHTYIHTHTLRAPATQLGTRAREATAREGVCARGDLESVSANDLRERVCVRERRPRLQATLLNRNLIFFERCIGHWSHYARISGHAVFRSLLNVPSF